MDKHEAQFTNFKIHSQYSICEGAVKIDELSDYCKENKIKAIGLCDSLNLCGALEFSEKISKVGTQPIIGTNINFKQNNILGKLPLFAKTKKGFPVSFMMRDPKWHYRSPNNQEYTKALKEIDKL